MERLFLVLSGVQGLLAVGLGAFGAHGLKGRFAPLADAAQRMVWWQTAAQYHMVHALALALSAQLIARGAGTPGQISGFCFLLGSLLFSGSLYLLAFTGIRSLGAITPFGGFAFLAGWAAVIVAALRMRT